MLPYVHAAEVETKKRQQMWLNKPVAPHSRALIISLEGTKAQVRSRPSQIMTLCLAGSISRLPQVHGPHCKQEPLSCVNSLSQTLQHAAHMPQFRRRVLEIRSLTSCPFTLDISL